MIGKTPDELLREHEEAWRPRIEKVSLVAELEFTRQELNTILACVGLVWDRAGGLERARRRMRASYPAAFAVAIAGNASLRYEGRNAWEPITEGAGLRYDANVTSTLGRTFLDCLETLSLPTFPELDDEGALRFLSRMLLHGGIPLDHLDEWFEATEHAIRQLDNDDPVTVYNWLVERAESKRLYRATVPVERFLRFGGEFAIDFLDRSLELIARVRAGDGIDDIRVGLPRRYVARAIELRDQKMLPGQRRPRSTVSTPRVRPSLRFDPYGLGVHLLLPPVPDQAGPLTWTVTVDGDPHTVTTRPPRPEMATQPAEVPLPSTATEVEVARHGSPPVVMRVISPEDPLLLFDRNGERVERGMRLPRDAVWVVHPSDRELEHEGGRPIEIHDTAARWAGWTAALYDLGGCTELHLDGGRRWMVEVNRSAEMRDVVPVENVRTADGHEALSAWSVLVLPGSPGGSNWEVTVERLDTGDKVLSEFDVGTDDVTVPLGPLADPFEGRTMRIRARGPLGRSLRRDVVVVTGLEVESEPPLRTFNDEGLSPTRVTMNGVSLQPFVMPPDETAREVALDGGLQLVVEPPSIAVRYLQTAEGSSWRFRPIRLDLESVVEEPGDLLVRLPDHGREPHLAVHDSVAGIRQKIPPTGRARSDGTVLFNLARGADTVSNLGSAALVVDSDVWSGLIATVRPQRLAESVQLQPDRGILQFVGVKGSGVQAAIYTRLAPMREPAVIDVPAGDPAVPIPDDLLGVGPLRLLLRVEDPWAPEEWPDFPTPGSNTHDLDAPSDDALIASLHPLAPFLAGAPELPDVSSRLGDAVTVFRLAGALNVTQHTSEIRKQIAAELAQQPEAALWASLDMKMSGSELAATLCDTGLVALPVKGDLSIDDVDRLWARWPAAGLLGLVPHLNASASDRDAAITLLEEQCGTAAQTLTSGEYAEVLGQPRFDMPQLIEWSPEKIRGIRAASNLVPRVLLDGDQRASEGFTLLLALVEQAEDSRLPRLIREAEKLAQYALLRIIDPSDVPPLSQGIRARIQGDNWQLLPAVSLALAANARLAVRAPEPLVAFNAFSQRALSTLASIAPGLVAGDLVMAELVIQGAIRE